MFHGLTLHNKSGLFSCPATEMEKGTSGTILALMVSNWCKIFGGESYIKGGVKTDGNQKVYVSV